MTRDPTLVWCDRCKRHVANRQHLCKRRDHTDATLDATAARLERDVRVDVLDPRTHAMRLAAELDSADARDDPDAPLPASLLDLITDPDVS